LKHLPLALGDLQNITHRSAMCEASLLAGMAMSETQTALAHALSYDLTLQEGYSHGEAVATWLPYVAKVATKDNAALSEVLKQALGTSQDPAVFLHRWLTLLGIAPRDLDQLPQGLETLHQALASARGKNQIHGLNHAS
jgi:alcohol dehydrogenase class IV